MQPSVRLSLVILLALVGVTSAWSQVITVVTEEYPPYNYRDRNSQQITGMATEVMQEVMKRANLSFKLDLYPWARAYQMAQDAPNVLIYSIGRSEKRESLFKWVDVIAPYDVYLYRLASRPEVTVADTAAIKNYKIGAVRDDVRAQYLEGLGVTLDLVKEDHGNIKKLESRRIDMFPIDELGMVAVYKREGMDPASVVKVIKLEALSAGLYMAFSKQTADAIVQRCQVALTQIKKDGTFEKIRVRYLN